MDSFKYVLSWTNALLRTNGRAFLTSAATVEFDPHRDVLMPRTWRDAYESSSHRMLKAVDDDYVSVEVSLEDLNADK